MNYAAVQPPPPSHTTPQPHAQVCHLHLRFLTLSLFVRRYPSSASSPIILIMFNTVIIPALFFSVYLPVEGGGGGLFCTIVWLYLTLARSSSTPHHPLQTLYSV